MKEIRNLSGSRSAGFSRRMRAVVLPLFLALPFLFTACTKDPEHHAQATTPEDVDLTMLEMWTHTVPVHVDTDMAWRVEFEGDAETFSVTPEEGNGAGIIELSVMKNAFDYRKKADMTIVFPEDTSKNIVYHLCQKTSADYGDNVGNIELSNQVYVVGFGYNVDGELANISSLLSQILDHKKLAEDKKIGFLSQEEDFNTTRYTARSASELSKKLSVNASLGGKGKSFSGEIKASFNKNQIESSSSEFAVTYLDYAFKPVTISEKDPAVLATKYLTPGAYNAINGLVPQYATPKADDPTKQAFKDLIKYYGTHVIMTANLGGRLKYSMCVDVSKVEGSYDLDAFANAGYNNKKVEVSAGASIDCKESFKKNSESYSFRLQAFGGNQVMNGPGTDTDQNIETWKASLKCDLPLPDGQNISTKDYQHNLAWVGCPPGVGMIPLYDLVDRVKYPERYKALKEYMTGEEVYSSVEQLEEIYDCPQPARFMVPEFNSADPKESLVKDVLIGDGQCIAKVCSEFVPYLSKKSRVTVVYPVFDNKVKLNMGYFIGDSGHAPKMVSWQYDDQGEMKCVVAAYEDDKTVGARKEIFLSGSSFRVEKQEECVQGRTEDYTVMSYDGKDNKKCNYPIVKVFDNFWARKNYGAIKIDKRNNIPDSCYYFVGYQNKTGKYPMYKKMVAEAQKLAPVGWHVATARDFYKIDDFLGENDITATGDFFLMETENDKSVGWSGLNVDLDCRGITLRSKGETGTFIFHIMDPVTPFWTSDQSLVTIGEGATFDVQAFKDHPELLHHCGSIRFVKNSDHKVDTK